MDDHEGILNLSETKLGLIFQNIQLNDTMWEIGVTQIEDCMSHLGIAENYLIIST